MNPHVDEAGVEQRTLASLDWPEVARALIEATRTPMGAEAARALRPLPSRDGVNEAYAVVAELNSARMFGSAPPLNGVADVRDELARAAKGMVLEAWSLVSVGGALAGIIELHGWLRQCPGPLLQAFALPIQASPLIVRRLRESFDRDGQIADSAFPALAALRQRLDHTRIRIQATFDAMLADEGLAEMLMDRYVTERDGRLVLPVKMSFRKGLGISHGTSASGETAYVEPGQTVEMQNDLRELRDAVDAEVSRILAELSSMVADAAPAALKAIAAVGVLDLASARCELGLLWNGSIPEVGQSGVITLRQARHPVLALRRLTESGRDDVVGNALELDDQRRCLVLTGPNAGGKTVALKTVGLAALLVRMAIPLPAAEGGRVDFFSPIFADIGDQQSITSDQSTFSGHLGLLKTALERAEAGTLVLVDEVAVGTDPAQGAALAAAVVEALVQANARVVVTTHYPELKSSDDSRILVGGMEFADGRPTYRLKMGRAAGSQALVIAQRVGLPREVLERAHTLLDAGQARLAKLAEKLEDEREAVRTEGVRLQAELRRVGEVEADIRERERRLAATLEGERERLVEKTRTKLKTLEDEVAQLVREIHANPTLKDGNAGLATIRAARAGLISETPAVMYEPQRGERVWVATVGQHGTVVSVQGDSADVQVKAIKLRVPFAKLGKSKDDPRLLVAEKPLRPPSRPSAPAGPLRVPSNTLDLRGMRLDEAIHEVERFLSVILGRGERYAYLLHGHGTGALKTGLRERVPAMPFVKRMRSGDAAEGGDAFTVVEFP